PPSTTVAILADSRFETIVRPAQAREGKVIMVWSLRLGLLLLCGTGFHFLCFDELFLGNLYQNPERIAFLPRDFPFKVLDVGLSQRHVFLVEGIEPQEDWGCGVLWNRQAGRLDQLLATLADRLLSFFRLLPQALHPGLLLPLFRNI